MHLLLLYSLFTMNSLASNTGGFCALAYFSLL